MAGHCSADLCSLLPITTDTVIYTATSWYFHYNGVCWIGFCSNKEIEYNEEEGEFRLSFASFLFLFTLAIAASRFTLWPAANLGPSPTGTMNFLYKIWLGIVIHNFTENLMWNALFQFITYSSKILYNNLKKLINALELNEALDDLAIIRGTFVRIILTVISLSLCTRVMNCDGYVTEVIARIKLYVRKEKKEEKLEEDLVIVKRQKHYKKKPSVSPCCRRSKTNSLRRRRSKTNSPHRRRSKTREKNSSHLRKSKTRAKRPKRKSSISKLDEIDYFTFTSDSDESEED